jgi:hypothetical protein
MVINVALSKWAVCKGVGIDLAARIAPALVAVSREQAHAGERRRGSGLGATCAMLWRLQLQAA